MNVKSFIYLGALAGVGAVLSSCVSAPIGGTKVSESKGTVRSGQRVQVAAISLIKPDCTYASYPYVAIVKSSSHGKIDMTHGMVHAKYASDSPVGMCKNPVQGTMVFYTSDPGFTGTDQFTIRYTGLNVEGGVKDNVMTVRVVK